MIDTATDHITIFLARRFCSPHRVEIWVSLRLFSFLSFSMKAGVLADIVYVRSNPVYCRWRHDIAIDPSTHDSVDIVQIMTWRQRLAEAQQSCRFIRSCHSTTTSVKEGVEKKKGKTRSARRRFGSQGRLDPHGGGLQNINCRSLPAVAHWQKQIAKKSAAHTRASNESSNKADETKTLARVLLFFLLESY